MLIETLLMSLALSASASKKIVVEKTTAQKAAVERNVVAAADKPAPAPLSAGPAGKEKEEDDEEEQPGAAPTVVEDPSDRLYDKYELQRGFYIASDLGFFMVFGGANKAVSNLQPYVGINVGYDILRWFSWQVHAGRGFAASSPRSANQDQQNRIRDFSVTNVLTGPVVWILVLERLAIELKLHGGISILDPIPLEAAIDGVAVPGVVGVVGGGAALKYLTLLTDFTLGLDFTFNYLLSVNVPSLQISPTVRYTF